MIEQTIEVPTGHICIMRGERALLEFLSIGDYGKDVNLKCDAMGLTREPNPVRHTKLLPLEEKWVTTISTQYGCKMRCNFCDVPKVRFRGNASLKDMCRQVVEGIQLHPEVVSTKRLNIHFARMGEPTWNPAVLDTAKWLKTHIAPEYRVHPVVSTMMPNRNEWLKTFIHSWMRVKNRLYRGNAGLQLSINSTNEDERTTMFGGCACTLAEIAAVLEGVIPFGRKITLNFALAGWEIEPDKLLKYFSPADYIIKLTPMHKTAAAIEHEIATDGDYTEYEPYRAAEESLKAAGYDVLVFIASHEEDDSRITCGNAILAQDLIQAENDNKKGHDHDLV